MGTVSLSSSIHLPTASTLFVVTPVMLPSGRAMFVTSPAATTFPPAATIGMVVVAWLAASAASCWRRR